jgi:uncharacterized protein
MAPVVGEIMDYHDGLAERIEVEGASFRPLYMDESGTPDLDKAVVWVRAFWNAISLVPDCWQALAEDERTEILVSPFASFLDLDKIPGMEAPDDIDQMRRDDAEFIPQVLPTLRVFAQIGGIRSSTTRRSPKVGRNEPCPCGSGKKYKRCCGAGA